eukprot:6717551-Prymnesium_polylepis.1
MLSEPGIEYGGGELEVRRSTRGRASRPPHEALSSPSLLLAKVGAALIAAGRGDMYVYPAGVAHRVRPLMHGRRLTLVIALEDATVPSAR